MRGRGGGEQTNKFSGLMYRHFTFSLALLRNSRQFHISWPGVNTHTAEQSQAVGYKVQQSQALPYKVYGRGSQFTIMFYQSQSDGQRVVYMHNHKA
jgi:hypothetical protein